MENIGDYLYLIVILALGLVGALRKKKSPRTADRPEPSDEEQVASAPVEMEVKGYAAGGIGIEAEDDFWKEIVEEDSSSIGAEPALFNSANEGVSAFIDLDVPDSIDTHGKDEINNEFPDLLEKESPASEIASRFNLPEAIVYSEILNRKENF